MTKTFNQPILKKDANDNVIQDSFADRAFQGEYTGTNLIYRGYARPGTATSVSTWQIAKLAYDGANNVLSIKWPQSGGIASSEYIFKWDDRAGYTYS
jgi:hypothetical protein